MRVDLEAGATESVHRESQERGVLEYATAESDTIQPGAVTQTAAGPHHHVSEGRVEATPNLLGTDLRKEILDDSTEDVRRLDDNPAIPLRQVHRVHPIGLWSRQRFELHGGLGLEVHPIPEPQKAGDGVEEPAGAGCRRRIEAPLSRTAQNAPRSAVQAS